jgi:hypothetical protein
MCLDGDSTSIRARPLQLRNALIEPTAPPAKLVFDSSAIKGFNRLERPQSRSCCGSDCPRSP